MMPNVWRIVWSCRSCRRLQITFLPGVAPRYADLISTVVAVADKNAEEKRDV